MKKISLVFQTHWDREWYYPVDVFNIRMKKILTRVLDLLDQNQIESFVFDGQVKALEDYFSICSKDEKKRIIARITEGKIIIGPWYVLSDEFLVSGESLVRNLEKGIQKAKAIYDYQKLGYLPDTFGHISQMPQILKQFGLDSCVLWRGVLPKTPFFQWEAPNHDQVFTVFLKEGYYQPIIDQDQYIQLMTNFVQKYEKFTDYDHILLTNGGDHLAPAKNDIRAHINNIEKELKIDVVQSDYEEYIASIENKDSYPVISGELRDNQNCYLLPNVLSSRIHLKQQNQLLEEKLKVLETLIAKTYLGKTYLYEDLYNQLWETLLLNHPHDSICGCGVDDLHSEMDARNLKLHNQIDTLIHEIYYDIADLPETTNNTHKPLKMFADDTKFNLFNPTTRSFSGFKKITLFIQKDNPLVDHFVVSDGVINYTTMILSKKETKRFESPLDDAPQFRYGYEYEIVFRVKNIRGTSHQNYELVEGMPLFLSEQPGKVIENQYVKIMVHDEVLSITDKVNQKTYHKMNQVISSIDTGDTYNYSKPDNDILSVASIIDSSVKIGPYYQEMNLSSLLSLPSEYLFDEQKPSTNLVQNQIQTKLYLYESDPQIYVDIVYHNQAKDQRTRICFDLEEQIDAHYSDTSFDIVKREVREEVFHAEKQKEVPVVVDPSHSFIETSNGLRFNHIGLQEYQITRSKHDQLEVTILRSVGSLSRDDLHARGGGAGPKMATPDAQMIGMHEVHFGLLLGQKIKFTHNDFFRLPFIVKKGHVKNPNSLIQISNPHVFVSSIRRRNNRVELRVYNPTNDVCSLDLYSSQKIDQIVCTNLLGEPNEKQVHLIQPKEIKTLLITFQNPTIYHADALVCGGSIGGVMAALKLCEKGKQVVLTEETNWIGGQLTAQAVPLDEHPFIERFGSTKTYRSFRDKARKYYQDKYQISDEASMNPGGAWVTRLAFEPKIAKQLFDEMISPYIGKNLILLTNTIAVQATKMDHTVTEIVIENKLSGERSFVLADYYLDGTDTGSLLPITKTAYVTGAESKKITNEPHAKEEENQADMQPVTYVCALTWDPSNKQSIEKPESYEKYRQMMMPYDSKPVLSEFGPDSSTGKSRKFDTYQGKMPLWTYRRYFDPVRLQRPDLLEKTTLNWPQNDYFMGNIFDDEFEDIHFHEAKELTKSFLYYLQTEVPRHDGGFGYPEMTLVKEDLGTTDGFAQYPYIRESRRIQAKKTILEQDILASTNPTLPHVLHSIGIGSYHIDLHITTKTNQFFYDRTWPFEIPLEALVPIETTNVIPCCKNIGTTHLTNGSFRLHPVEWNIGESAGLLCSFLIDKKVSLHEMIENESLIKEFQTLLEAEGIELHWPENEVHII